MRVPPPPPAPRPLTPCSPPLPACRAGEALTGKGALAQFDVETGLPLSETEPLLLLFIVSIFLLAILPSGSGKFVDE